MTAVIVYVVLVVATEGVPLIVHVPPSIFKPVGREGETVQVAPVTSVMPLPEPLAVVELAQVLLPITSCGVSSTELNTPVPV